MSEALAERPTTTLASRIESVLIRGDLSQLTDAERLTHYKNVCDSLGLNPLTTPFDYLKLNGRTVLYAKREATEQLRKLHGVSITEIQTQKFDDVYVVTAKAMDKTGRTDASTGAVPLGNLRGEALANAIMKAETKAKRRVTLSICGLGMLDETEVGSIPTAQPEGYTVIPTPKEYQKGDATGQAVAQIRQASETTHEAIPAGPSPSPGAALTIERIDVTDTPNPNVKHYAIILSNGEQFETRNPQISALAEQLCQDGAAVEIVKGPRGGFQGFKRASTAPVDNAAIDAEIAAQEAF